MKGAVFLDRDGTLIELVHHLKDPADVTLIPGAAAAVRDLRAAGWPVIIITNQSVIGRGMLTEAGLADIHAEMDRQLAREGAAIDGIYFCPLRPTQKDPTVIEDPMRKPGPGMLQQAAADHGLALDQCWMVGDTASDMGAGRNAGCPTILVRTGYGAQVTTYDDLIDYAVPSLAEAAQVILKAGERL